MISGDTLYPLNSFLNSDRIVCILTSGLSPSIYLLFSFFQPSSSNATEPLDIGSLLIRKDHNNDIEVNHLNIRENGNFTLENLSFPLKLQKLSFEPKANIIFNAEKVGRIDKWEPQRLKGVLDITNMRVQYYPNFRELEPKGGGKIIGGRVDLLISEQGVIGTSDWLKEQNRRTIVGITNPRNSEEFKRFCRV